jgi:hypothetical protein
MRNLAGLAIILSLLYPHSFVLAQVNAESAMTLPEAEVETGLPKSHPSAYYTYAMRLFRADRKNDAVKWFYIGQLRYRYHLRANPNLPPDGEPALMASLNATVGQPINEWAGGSPKDWAASIDSALQWDAVHENKLTPKSKFAKVLQETRAGLVKLRGQILAQEDQIRAARKLKGLQNR